MQSTLMFKEIQQIPHCTADLIQQESERFRAIGLALRTQNPQLMATIARGSSDHAAHYFKYACEILTGIPVVSMSPSLASLYHTPFKLPRTCALAISQSGQSPDTRTMLKAMQTAGALGIALTNQSTSPLNQWAQYSIPLHCGAEQSVAATKTFFNSVVAGLLILSAWTNDVELHAAMQQLPQWLDDSLTLQWDIMQHDLQKCQSLYVVGRGPDLAIAAEMALKFKETCLIHAEAFSSAEVLHGPATLVGQDFPIVALASQALTQKSMLETLNTLVAQHAQVFLIGAQHPGCHALPCKPQLHPLLDPLLNIVPFYLFVENLARCKGLNPDQPRFLHKVTKTF